MSSPPPQSTAAVSSSPPAHEIESQSSNTYTAESIYEHRIDNLNRLYRPIVETTVYFGLLSAVQPNTFCQVVSKLDGCYAVYLNAGLHAYGLFFSIGYAFCFTLTATIFPIIWPLLSLVSDLESARHATKSWFPKFDDPTWLPIHYGITCWLPAFKAAQYLWQLCAVLTSKTTLTKWSLRPPSALRERTSWQERILLISCSALVVLIGTYTLHTLRLGGIAEVTNLDFYFAIVPFEILVGLHLATELQPRLERWGLMAQSIYDAPPQSTTGNGVNPALALLGVAEREIRRTGRIRDWLYHFLEEERAANDALEQQLEDVLRNPVLDQRLQTAIRVLQQLRGNLGGARANSRRRTTAIGSAGPSST
jgi:hypothetical protein